MFTLGQTLPLTGNFTLLKYIEALAPGIRSGVPQFDLKVPRLFRVLRVSPPGAAG